MPIDDMLPLSDSDLSDAENSVDIVDDGNMVQLLERKAGLYLRMTEHKGRGLFCMYPIAAGEELETTPALILNETDSEKTEDTLLRDYVFRLGDVSDEFRQQHGIENGEETCCVVMGIASYCNDDVDYNAEVVYEEFDGTLYYTLQAIKDIPAHTEICTSYGEGWFQDRGFEGEDEGEAEDTQKDNTMQYMQNEG